MKCMSLCIFFFWKSMPWYLKDFVPLLHGIRLISNSLNLFGSLAESMQQCAVDLIAVWMGTLNLFYLALSFFCSHSDVQFCCVRWNSRIPLYCSAYPVCWLKLLVLLSIYQVTCQRFPFSWVMELFYFHLWLDC